MSVPKIICDRKTREKLGEDGLTEVQSQLHAVDCQTCGRPLGTDAPALVVNEMGEWGLPSCTIVGVVPQNGTIQP